MSGSGSAILVVIVAIFLPPVAVLMIAGCGADFLVNLLLTILGYFPGHIHAFYLIYIWYDRRSQARNGTLTGQRAPGIFSDSIQNGGTRGYRSGGAGDMGHNGGPTGYRSDSAGDMGQNRGTTGYTADDGSVRPQWRASDVHNEPTTNGGTTGYSTGVARSADETQATYPVGEKSAL